MKKLISLLLLLSLVLLLLPCAAAAAEEPGAAERGLEKIKTARNWQNIVLPQEESYLDEWKTLYPRAAFRAPNLAVMSAPALDSGLPNAPYVFEGTTVTVVAEENEMSCMLYRVPGYKLYVGWIQSIRLLEDFPGEESVVGQPFEGAVSEAPEPELRWSDWGFPGSQQRYTILEEPVRDCVGFTYEYQLIDENDARPEALFGERTIYVYDGESWTPVGTFAYPALGTVRVQVWLEEPIDVCAIGCTADCPASELFEFRQTAQDFLTKNA